MPQVFSAKMNVIARASIVGALGLLASALWVGLIYTRSSYGTGMGVSVVQPVPFSHQHHVGILGIDCRYCHTSVEHSSFAGMPPTKTCMNCHSPDLGRQPDAGAGPRELPHRPVAPLAAGLQSARLRLFRPQHSRAEGHRLLVVPRADRRDAVHLSSADAADGVVPRLPPQPGSGRFARAKKCSTCKYEPPADQLDLGRKLVKQYGVKDAASLTSCSTCHR